MVKNRKEYETLLKSGMFWEFHPELTGQWEIDKFEIGARKDLKEVVKYMLNTDDEDIIKNYVDAIMLIFEEYGL